MRKEMRILVRKQFKFYFIILSVVLSKYGIVGSSSGAASSVFSSRGGQKSSRNDNSNSNNNNIFEDWSFDVNTTNGRDSLGNPIPDEQILISKLLRNYDPAARPVYNASKPVIVNFGFALIQICDMDERNQILTTNVWFEQEWIDERLFWNQSEYNNLDKIRIPCNRVWLPDIVLYNSADDYTEGYMQSKAMVKPNGVVFWPPPAKLRSSCKIDVTFFPFDDQLCHMKFGSWTYSGLQLNLMNKSSTVDLSNYIKSGEWELLSVTVERNERYYPCCPDEPFPDVIFYIHLRRRILYFLFNIILPCIWLSILSLIGFWLPPDSGEKITLGITVLLAFSVFMLLIAENIPATSEMVPLIGVYLTVTMSLTSLSIILTVLVLQLHHAGPFAPVIPRRLFNFMTKRVANFLCMSSTVRRHETNKKLKSNKNNSIITLKKTNQNDHLEYSLENCENELKKLKNSLELSNGDHLLDKACLNYYCCYKCLNKQVNSNSEEKPVIKMNGDLLINLNNETNSNGKIPRSYTADQEEFYEITSKNRGSPCKQPCCYRTPNTVQISVKNSHYKQTKPMSNNISTSNHKVHYLPNENSSHACKCGHREKSHHHRGKSTSNQSQKDLIETVEVFAKNLKQYMAKHEKETAQTDLQNEWKLIALIVDRLLFWIFTFLTVVSTVVLLIVVPVLKNRNLIQPYMYSENTNWN